MRGAASSYLELAADYAASGFWDESIETLRSRMFASDVPPGPMATVRRASSISWARRSRRWATLPRRRGPSSRRRRLEHAAKMRTTAPWPFASLDGREKPRRHWRKSGDRQDDVPRNCRPSRELAGRMRSISRALPCSGRRIALRRQSSSARHSVCSRRTRVRRPSWRLSHRDAGTAEESWMVPAGSDRPGTRSRSL